MQTLDLTLPTPAENLALDEALLDAVEAGETDETLRFWESPTPFVVVGYGNNLRTEVDLAACAAENIPVLRRCSGGGTVLQGPGCLSYAVVLRFAETGPLATITGANHFIMQRQQQALQQALGKNVTISGHTDLAVEGRKFSGNAQRRKKNALLFHGTFLLQMDEGLIERCLHFPSKVPDYRQQRPHRDFLTNLGVDAQAVKAALRRVWSATVELTAPPTRRVKRLCEEKYDVPEWHAKLP